MLIKQIIRLNTNAEFFNDVQLRWYWEPEKNAKLAKGYIFTRQAGENRKSTVDALNMVRFGLTDPGSENRMLFLATFGQGKTHLALAMANFFGKPPESEEVQYLFASLRHAYGDNPAVKNFTELKERHPRHLVVCLQGDEIGFDLGSYFVREVERSLAPELSSSGGMLPLWFKTALQILDTKIVQHQLQADAFLSVHDMDLPKLRQRLELKDPSLYDIVRDLIEHVTGVRPDLGPRLSLNALVSHVCKEYCGPDKPYAGLVVLFDEFNAFMHSYSKSGVPGALQDLLNGIANNRDRSVFVGFAQRDPMTIVNALPPMNRDALTVEMNRIPQGNRTWLFNNLETVLDSYIGADETALMNALQEAQAWPALLQAEEETQMLFRRRYERELQWTQEQFRTNVTIGCFPLHPLTTALLCSVDLAETGNNTRGLLQFVLKSKEGIEEKPAAADGVPTWVCATRMVDWFEKTLCVEELHWEQYQKAVYDGGGDLPDLQKEVLKAMLLHLIAKLPMANVKYEQAIALLAGLTHEDAATALKAMTDRNLIDRDAINNKYAFLSASGGDRDLRAYINREVAQTPLRLDTLQDPATITVTGFRPTEVPVEWGNSADWQATPNLLTSEFFNPDSLRKLLVGKRGVVVWLIPLNENDRTNLEAKAQAVVDEASGTIPQPVLVYLPPAPFPGIHEGLKKLQLLATLPSPKRVEFAAYLPNNKQRINDQLREQMQVLRGTAKKWFAHSSLTPALQADALSGDALIKRVVTDCFKKSPSSFIQSQREDNAKLRKASALLGKLLLSNQALNLQQQLQLQPNDGNLKMAENILDSILTIGRPAAWGVVSTSKHLQEPTNNKVRLAWDELCNAFPSGGSAADPKAVIERLRNAPFGYDSNSLTLLLCSWIGFYRHDLEITLGTAAFSIALLQKSLDEGKPAAFIDSLILHRYKIKRRDRTVALREIQDILLRVQQISTNPLTRQEASNAVIKLEEFLADPGNSDQTLRERVAEAKDRVKSDLESADSYDAKAQDLIGKLNSVTKVTDALNLLMKARDLPSWSGVKPTQPAVVEIVSRADTALAKTVDERCQRLSKLQSITDFGRQEDELKNCHKALHEKTQLQNKVVAALAALAEAKTKLEAQQVEDATLKTIEAFSIRVPLVELEKNLERLNAIKDGGEKLTVRVAAKKSEIAQQISSLSAFVDSLDTRAQAVKDATDLRALEREIDSKAPLFNGHTLSAKLVTASARLTELAEFFHTLTNLNQRTINNPQDLTSVLGECAAARQKYESRLATLQLGLIDQVESTKRHAAETKTQSAREWQQGLSQAWQADGSNPTLFLKKLDGMPAFLPEDAKVAVAALREEVNKKIELLKLQQAQDAIVKTIEAFSVRVPLVELEKNLERLNAIKDGGDQVAVKKNAKAAEITGQITAITAFVDSLDTRAQAVKDATDLRALEREIDSKAPLFNGHTLSAKLVTASARLTELAEFFHTLTNLNQRTINNPQDLTSVLGECAAARQKYESRLATLQLGLIDQVESTKRHAAETKTQSAREWQQGLSQAWQADGSNPTLFLKKLDGMPAFLPEDAKVAVAALREEVNKKIESNEEEWIVTRFRGISDKSRRERLLKRLQELLMA